VAEDTVMRTMLFDFYSGMLTDKQRECFDLHYNEDLSLAEIAEQEGISRQGVWDNIRRAQKAMEEIEDKTGIIKRYSERMAEIEELKTELDRLRKADSSEIISITNHIEKKLDTIRA